MKARRALILSLIVPAVLVSTASCKGCDAKGIEEGIEKTTTMTSRTGISVEIKLIRGQIEIYRRMNGGQNPPSLQAMDTLPRLKYGEEYNYDATTGVVTSNSYPSI